MYLFNRLFRILIRSGPLTVIDANGRRGTFGERSPAVRPVTIRFTDHSTPRRIASNPAKGAGEAYMDERLIVEEGNIRDLIDLIGYNTRWDADNPTRIKLWRPQQIAATLDTWHWQRRSKRNVAHHYDLAGSLYDLFLATVSPGHDQTAEVARTSDHTGALSDTLAAQSLVADDFALLSDAASHPISAQ